MSANRVRWHRSLFFQLFTIGALIALVAVVAATWAISGATTVAVRQEQQQTLHADATVYDSLIGYAATHKSWTGASGLVNDLARQTGQQLALTDELGRPLLPAGGSRDPRPATQPVATLDPLDVDSALLGSAGGVIPTNSQPPCRGNCRQYVVAPYYAIDSRVVSQFNKSTNRKAWRGLQQTIDACLQRSDLHPVLALYTNFDALVAYPDQHQTVATCLESSLRATLAAQVAPPALLFVGADPKASVFWDLSGHSRLRIALLAGAVLLVTLALSALLAGHVVRPLRRMASAALRASEGDLAVRVPAGRADEIGEVARAFNVMADRREQLEEARRRLVSDVSHELRTPLANVRGWLEAAQDGLVRPGDRLLASLHDEALHLQHLIDDLHDLALADVGELRLEPEPIDLAVFLAQARDAFGGAAEAAGVRVAVRAEPGATVTADPTRIRQAVGNLIGNALRHTPSGGTITLSGASGTITVADSGDGIPSEEVPYVFERFRRADPSRSRATGGSGLGLAIVRQFIDAHGGRVELASAPGDGTTVTITLAP